jgi:hypothetical protein
LRAYPFQTRKVVERGCGIDELATSNPSKSLGDRERRGFESVGGIGGTAGGDLGLDELVVCLGIS